MICLFFIYDYYDNSYLNFSKVYKVWFYKVKQNFIFEVIRHLYQTTRYKMNTKHCRNDDVSLFSWCTIDSSCFFQMENFGKNQLFCINCN